MPTQANLLTRLRVQPKGEGMPTNRQSTTEKVKSAIGTAVRAASVAGAVLMASANSAFAQQAAGGLSSQVTDALTNRLPTAAANQAGNMATITQFFIWVLGAVLIALVGFGVVEGVNGRGWGKAFASVIGSVAIAILVAVVLQATA